MEEKKANPRLSHLGWSEEVPTMAMFTPSDDGDWFPGNLTSEVYEIVVGGPRLKCLDGLGFGLGWALRGRVFHPKGVLPTSVFTPSQPMEIKSPLFHKELFFTLRQVGTATDSKCVYQVKFTPVPLWPEDWQQHRPKPNLKKSSKVISQTQSYPTGPHSRHARGLGLSLDYLDRMDRPLPVKGHAKADITVWRTPQFSPLPDSVFCVGSSSPLEADCVEILFNKIFEKAQSIPVYKPKETGRARGDVVTKTEEKHESLPVLIEEQPKVPDTPIVIEPKKRSFKKKLGSFMRRLFGCAASPSQEH
ncbi:uncharacterized protein LOC135480402 [Liolophura sinensis]|uniref:uncharacterized protein LOC135480402 n=1 Tax=Liolophura sinensis TaxID=3198878 RepID=UPI003158740B